MSFTIKQILERYQSGKQPRLRGGGLQENRSARNNQNNSGNATDILTDSGDILINNRIGNTVRLPIGNENQTLNVSQGQPVWQNSARETFRESYVLEAGSPFWNATWGENGVPYDQESLTRYSNAWNVRAKYLEVNTTSGAIDEITTGVGSFSTGNLTLLKSNTQNVWATCICDNEADIKLITDNLGTTGASAITTMTTFVTDNVLSGIDIDFTDYLNWQATTVTNLNTWLGSLKSGLEAIGSQLNLNLPIIANASQLAGYNFDYSTFIANVSFLTIKCYDINIWDGRYTINCPIEAITGGRWSDTNTGDFNGPVQYYDKGCLGKFEDDVGANNMYKLIVALPNFGYVHTIGQGDTTFSETRLLRNKLALNGTYATDESSGNRDFQSHELYWEDGSYRYRMVDEIALQRKADAIRVFLDKWDLANPTKTPARREIVLLMGGNCPNLQRP